MQLSICLVGFAGSDPEAFIDVDISCCVERHSKCVDCASAKLLFIEYCTSDK